MRENIYIKYSKYYVYQKYSHIPLFFRFHNQNQIFLDVWKYVLLNNAKFDILEFH